MPTSSSSSRRRQARPATVRHKSDANVGLGRIDMAELSNLALAAAMALTVAAILTASNAEPSPVSSRPGGVGLGARKASTASHPGFSDATTPRACARTGSFVSSPEAASYSRSALFSATTIPVVARFSLGGGDPKAADAEKGPRGMALGVQAGRRQQAAYDHDQLADVLRHSAEDVSRQHARVEARSGDGQTRPRGAQGVRSDPSGQCRNDQILRRHNPPPSYANSAYYGIHTFKFIDKNDKTTLVKWRFVPEDGEKELTNAELKSMPARFPRAGPDRSR